MFFHWVFLGFFLIQFFLTTIIKPSASGVQIISPNLHHSCISVEMQSWTTAAETLGGHQDERAVLVSDITGESAYTSQLLWDREGESGLGEVETTWKGLNTSVQWGSRKREMNQWLAKSRPICIMRDQEGSADPRSKWFTQSVTCKWQNTV